MISKKQFDIIVDQLSWLKIFTKHIRLILLVFFTVITITVLITKFLIRPEYESTALVYAVPSYGPQAVIPPQHFGSDEDNEALIQILESIEVEKDIEKKYNLAEHYEIDDNSKKKLQLLIKKYKKNVTIKKTSHGSIEVSVRDTDPELAAKIANDIVKIGGGLLEEIKKRSVGIVLVDREQEYFTKKTEVDSLESELSKVRGLINPEDPYDLNSIKYVRLKKQFLGELGKLSAKKGKYELALNHYSARIPSYYSVDKAVPNYEKVYPRLFIVLAVVLAPITVIMFMFLSFIEKLEA